PLELATQEMEKALEQSDLDKWAAADDRFHRTMLEMHGNHRLSNFVKLLYDQVHRARIITLRLRERPVRSTIEHREILKHMLAGDAEAVRRTFRAHHQRAANELLPILEKYYKNQTLPARRIANVSPSIAVIKGDGIGPDVTEAALAAVEAALKRAGEQKPNYAGIHAGATYFKENGKDIENGGEERAGEADAIFLGAIGLPVIRHADGTEIAPHLRLRERYQLYAGVRPVRAYANTPRSLADPRSANIDLVILRESTEGLFYSAATHNRSQVVGDDEVRDILRITRAGCERVHRFGFELARKRKAQGKPGHITCVDKANVFRSMAFFREIFDEVAKAYPDVTKAYNYIDAQALDLIRRPWDFDILVMENMFGDILSDLAGGLVGGMGMAACAEIGDETALFQPAHGSAPDIMGQDKANPLAAILSGALMCDYLGDKLDRQTYRDAATIIDEAVESGFEQDRLRPIEFGGDMGTRAITKEVLDIITSR
ncbi:MAG TPA: isocitrate/isopropylmalate family dehydrogenase, partial [Hyphomicrobiales bacterium]|nr:isocitrate/isopropylmalate family dehydrogenase [Hyphomicrobiales bacterium]